MLSTEPRTVISTSLSILITSWTEVLGTLRNAAVAIDFGLFLSDLERMRELAEPDDFKNLTMAELDALSKANNDTASRTRNFMSLAGEIAKRSFADSQEDYAKYDNAWGSMWAGVYGRLGGFKAWIGLDAASWSEHGKSPIWIIFENQALEVRRRVSTILTLDHDYFSHKAGKRIAIPIPLIEGTRDEVLESCCDFAARISKLLIL
jgi:hypothetical protein